jgi:hypothetical protein
MYSTSNRNTGDFWGRRVSAAEPSFCYHFKEVMKPRSTVVILLLFICAAAPVLRCLGPGEILTAEEQACCKSMAGHCGDSPAANHPCCKQATSTAQPAVATPHVDVSTTFTIAAWLPSLAHSLAEPEFAPDWLVGPSPPVASLQQTSPILRI